MRLVLGRGPLLSGGPFRPNTTNLQHRVNGAAPLLHLDGPQEHPLALGVFSVPLVQAAPDHVGNGANTDWGCPAVSCPVYIFVVRLSVADNFRIFPLHGLWSLPI